MTFRKNASLNNWILLLRLLSTKLALTSIPQVRHSLQHVAGLNKTTARQNIVTYREENGVFTPAESTEKSPSLRTKKLYEQAVKKGFMGCLAEGWFLDRARKYIRKL